MPVVEFAKRLWKCGGVSLKGCVLASVYIIKLLLVMPFSFLQFIFYSRKIKNSVVTTSPVFILGHYRSGTTYLHKLLASTGSFAYVSYYDMLCPNSSLLFAKSLKVVLQFIINKLNIKTPFFNKAIPSLDEPAEEERFLINKGSRYTDYWRFVFPLSWNKWSSCAERCEELNYFQHWRKEYVDLLKLATYKHKGKQLILKSPPNTERIRQLLEIFPSAKFIYIERNPYHVFYSACNLWQKAIKKFCLQDISDEQIEELVFTHYAQLIDGYEKNKILIPTGNLIELKYEDLEADPLSNLERIFESLHIARVESIHSSGVIQFLEKEKQYKKFEYSYSMEIFKKIEKRWGKYIRKWNLKNEVQVEKIYA